MIHWSEIWTSDKTYVMLLPLKSKSLDQDQCNTKSQKKKKKKKSNWIGLLTKSNILKMALILFCSFLAWLSFFQVKALLSNNFCCNFVSFFINSKNRSQIFKVIFLTGEITISVHCGVISDQQFQIKSSFSSKKNTVVVFETQFSRKAVKF